MSGGKGATVDNVLYSCNECGEEFEIFRDLAKHKRAAQCRGEEIDVDEVWPTPNEAAVQVVSKNDLQCTQCDKIFKKQWSLNRHIQRHAMEAEKVAKVHQTDHPTHANNDAEEQIQNDHGSLLDDSDIMDISSENDLQCSQCNKMFKKQWTFNRHLQRHAMEAEKVAKVDEDVATDVAMLDNSDQETHVDHGEKPDEGETIDISSDDNDDFEQKSGHSDQEMDDNIPQSDQRANIFKRPSDPSNHKEAETLQKPFKCKHCDASFSRECFWMRHFRKTHGPIPYVSFATRRAWANNEKIVRDRENSD